jgi:hypothetical protein
LVCSNPNPPHQYLKLLVRERTEQPVEKAYRNFGKSRGPEASAHDSSERGANAVIVGSQMTLFPHCRIERCSYLGTAHKFISLYFSQASSRTNRSHATLSATPGVRSMISLFKRCFGISTSRHPSFRLAGLLLSFLDRTWLTPRSRSRIWKPTLPSSSRGAGLARSRSRYRLSVPPYNARSHIAGAAINSLFRALGCVKVRAASEQLFTPDGTAAFYASAVYPRHIT